MPKIGMREVRRKQVIEAAERCLMAKGFLHMSVKDIAAEAHVSTGIIYHYFKNKEDLLLQVIRESFRKSHERVMQTVEPLSGFEEKLLKHIENINAVPKDNPEFYTVLLNYLGQSKSDPEINRIIASFFKNLRAYVEFYLQKGIAENGVDLVKARHLPAILIGLGMGLGIQWTIDPVSFNVEEMEESFKMFFRSYLSSMR